MQESNITWKSHLIKSLKIAAAAVLSIAIAGELGLQYSASAGIITILSIQNTKRETLRSARNRGLAFLGALALATICFRILDYTLWAFAAYLFLFALLCLWAGWMEALAMDSVLITHFLSEGNMAPELILNECLLFLIGTSIGVLVNLHLRKRSSEFERLANEVDEQMKGIIKRMSQWLPKEDKDAYNDSCFGALKAALEAAKRCAAANYNNDLLRENTYELDYIRMREQQSVILKEIYVNIKHIAYLPKQTLQVAELLDKIEREYHKDNTVEGLLTDLEELLLDMKKQELPVSREEFEARAILFYILMQIRSLLEIKREYVINRCTTV